MPATRRRTADRLTRFNPDQGLLALSDREHDTAVAEPRRLNTPTTGAPVAYPPDAILTQEQVAAWLGISTRTLRKLPIRRWASSRRLVRYLGRHVLQYLEEQAT
jgi:hypothetical protein